jgi:hypothetical protein
MPSEGMTAKFRMLQGAIPSCAVACVLATWGTPADANARLDVWRWAANLPERYAVHGVKTEPTYEEELDLRREGDVFSVTGGAPGWSTRSMEGVSVSATGVVSRWPCGPSENCALAHPPSGFLATAALVAAERRGALASAVGIIVRFRRFPCRLRGRDPSRNRAADPRPLFRASDWRGNCTASSHERTVRRADDGPELGQN